MKCKHSHIVIAPICFFIFLMQMHGYCSSATDMKLVSIKKVILIEKNGIALRRAELVTIIPGKKLILAANLNTSIIGCWNIEDGTLTQCIKLPVGLSDSLYPASIADEKEVYWIENRKKVSRQRFDWGNDPAWFEHQLTGMSVSENGNCLYLFCNIKGTELDYKEPDKPRSVLSGIPAFVTYARDGNRFTSVKQVDFLIDSSVGFIRIWFNPANRMLISSMRNFLSWKKMDNSIDHTFCCYNFDEGKIKQLFARRTYSQSMVFVQGMSSFTWLTDSTFLFAHGDDKEIYDQTDKPVFKIPYYGEDTVFYDSTKLGPTNSPLMISRHATIIQNIFKLNGDTVGVFYYSRKTNESNMTPRIGFYSLLTGELFGTATPEYTDSRILNVCKGIEPGTLLMIRKTKEDVLLETVKLER